MALHADIKVKMKKQPRPEFRGFGWRRKSSHVQSFEDAAAWNPFEVRDRITFFPCRSSSIGLYACSGVPCSRTPEQDQLSKTKLHSSAQFLHMPAVEHSAPELKNRTSSQRQSYIVLHRFALPSQTVQRCKSSRGDRNFFYIHIAATWTAFSTAVCSWSQLDLYANPDRKQVIDCYWVPSTC